jgi:long-chain fatty acid transport protein
MGRFKKYAGLFAEAGDFDIPANYSIGIEFKPMPELTLAADYGRIEYSGVAAVGNPSTPPVGQLGAANGPGFGWKDINVYKFGAAWRMNDALTLRAGYNRSDNPITSRDVTFNILAPGVMKDHYTLGFTYSGIPDSEITGSLMIAPRQSVTGASSQFGGSETIGMRQTMLGVAWSRKF